MTREQKLALIVGFSLILFVGVLISDHLSSARKAKIGKVAQDAASAPISISPLQPPGPAPENHAAATPPGLRDPLDLIINAPITVAPTNLDPASPANVESLNPATLAANQPAANPNNQPASPVNQPVINLANNTLAEEVRNLGGDIKTGADGIPTISIPAAVATRPANTFDLANSPRSPQSQKPIATSVGPLQPLRTHEVRPGETLFQITQKHYGNGNLWRDLAKFNNMDKAGTVRTGARIKIPARDVLLGKAGINPDPKLLAPVQPRPQIQPHKAPARGGGAPKIELASYTVRKGDTLGDISRKTLGTSKRWQEIADLNNLDDEDSITAGTILRLPAKRS